MLSRSRAFVCAAFLAQCLACGTVSFQRDTASSGTFTATGLSVTLFGTDLPKGALMIARENASDANRPNMVVTQTLVIPYLGWFDWLLDVFSIRWAKISGTWGSRGKS